VRRESRRPERFAPHNNSRRRTSGPRSELCPVSGIASRWIGSTIATVKKAYTDKQGQYLAFIYYYTKVNGQPPAEADMQRYFRVTPPSVHQMALTLEANGFIERIPGQGRSIRLLIPREQLPDLE